MTHTQRTEKDWQRYYDEQARKGGSNSITSGFVTPRTFGYRKAAILETLSSLPIRLRDKWIADIGCGSGLITLPFLGHSRLIGIDISPEMVKLALGHGLHAAAASALAIPLRNSLFDVTISTGVVQHFSSSNALIRECARITRPGGFILIETINSESILRKIYRFFVRRDNLQSHPFTVAEIASALDQDGVEPWRIVYLYYPLTYRKTYTSTRATFIHRMLSSAFIVVATRR